MSPNPIRPVGQLMKRGLSWLAIIGIIVLGLCGLAAALILSRGPLDAALAVHDAISVLRPYVLFWQVGGIGLLWWFWCPLVRRANFIPPLETAWLAARHRLALWELGLTVLGGVLWFPR